MSLGMNKFQWKQGGGGVGAGPVLGQQDGRSK
jgi:hypothetical protein